MVEIVNTNHGDFNWKYFEKLPWHIYKKNPNWVPPLLQEQNKKLQAKSNPFFKDGKADYWIAFDGNKCVGRISAIVNRWHNRYYNDRTGFFGYFECINDFDVAQKLVVAASTWLKENGCERVLGPVNLSTSNECGFLIEGFNSAPVMLMNYNWNYYQDLFNDLGFKKEIDLLAYNVVTEAIYNDKKVMDKLKRWNNVLRQKEHITYRTINMNDYTKEKERIRLLFNDYMSENWGFVPIEKDEFDFLAESMKRIIVKDLAIFAEVNNEPVGFSLALPDANQIFRHLNGKLFPFGIFKYFYFRPKVSGLRVFFMGIKKAYRKKGLESVFYYRMIETARKKKYKYAELSWISERNPMMNQALLNMNAHPYKKYRVFVKTL